MKWTDDLFLEHCDERRRTLQLAMYAQHLATGSTLAHRQIKASTIKAYLRDVASFLTRFGERPVDPRKERGSERLHSMLDRIFKELERWEKVPKRREPFTVEMLMAMDNTAVFGTHSFTSKWSAIADWGDCGIRGGFRKTEFVQESNNSDIDNPLLDIYGNPKAFCLNDFRFRLKSGARLVGAAILAHSPDDMAYCWNKFRTQKNGDNDEEKMYTNSPTGRSFCRAVYRIIKRFVQLRGAADVSTPLAIYYDETSNVVRFITDADIESTFRTLAAHVYKLDPVKDKDTLQMWSCHSLRVGACTLLHANGFTGPQIQFLLRWRSDAFMLYLRNMPVLCNKQIEAFDNTAAMPELV